MATIDIGRKVGVLCPFLGAAGFPPNTMWPGPRPTFNLSFIFLIHPSVWPQYTNYRQTDRTGQTGHTTVR